MSPKLVHRKIPLRWINYYIYEYYTTDITPKLVSLVIEPFLLLTKCQSLPFCSQSLKSKCTMRLKGKTVSKYTYCIKRQLSERQKPHRTLGRPSADGTSC